MKRITYRTPNRVLIDTGHRTFDQKCEIVTTGNVCGDAQFSSYIRPYCETECNGHSSPVGHLRDFDLKHFTLPSHVRETVMKETMKQQGVLYEFRHFVRDWKRGNSNGYRKVVHGYILTRGHNENYRFVKSWVTGPTNKSYGVIETVKEYVSNPN